MTTTPPPLGGPPFQPPPPPPGAIYQQPRRPGGAGRFWLGFLAGGCAVLVLEFIVVVVASALIGTAIRNALQGSGSTGLPLPLPSGLLPSGSSGLPELGGTSDPCSPQPCAAHGGVTVLITNVNRNAGPGSTPGSHLIKFDVTFVGSSGSHTVTPQEFALDGSSGPSLPDSSPQGCSSPDQQTLQAGQRLGPYPVCFDATGSTTGDLTVTWIDPEDLTIIDVKLPAG